MYLLFRRNIYKRVGIHKSYMEYRKFDFEKDKEKFNEVVRFAEIFKKINREYSDSDGKILLATERENIYGAMQYFEIPKKQIKEDVHFLFERDIYKNTFQAVEEFIDTLSNKGDSIIYIEAMEAFEKRKGIGSGLIKAIIDENPSKYIFLSSVPNAENFYNKMNFQETGFTHYLKYSENGMPKRDYLNILELYMD